MDRVEHGWDCSATSSLRRTALIYFRSVAFLLNSDLNLKHLVDKFTRGLDVFACHAIQLQSQTLKGLSFRGRQTSASSRSLGLQPLRVCAK